MDVPYLIQLDAPAARLKFAPLESCDAVTSPAAASITKVGASDPGSRLGKRLDPSDDDGVRRFRHCSQGAVVLGHDSFEVHILPEVVRGSSMPPTAYKNAGCERYTSEGDRDEPRTSGVHHAPHCGYLFRDQPSNAPATSKRRLVPFAVLFWVVAGSGLLQFAATAALAHGPDRTVGGNLWNANQAVHYDWLSGSTPPPSIKRDDGVAFYAKASVSVDKVLSGSFVPGSAGELGLEVFLPNWHKLDEMANSLPQGRVLLFLRRQPDTAAPLYRIVNVEEGYFMEAATVEPPYGASDPWVTQLHGIAFDDLIAKVMSSQP